MIPGSYASGLRKNPYHELQSARAIQHRSAHGKDNSTVLALQRLLTLWSEADSVLQPVAGQRARSPLIEANCSVFEPFNLLKDPPSDFRFAATPLRISALAVFGGRGYLRPATTGIHRSLHAWWPAAKGT